MKKIFAITAFALLASCAAFVQSSPRASADAICFNNAAPTPMPTTGRPTLGICNNNILGVQIVGPGGSPIPTSGPTAAPGPTDTNGYPLVHPTAVGTLTVICASGCGAGSTPIPFATNASGQLIVAPTAIPTVNVLIQNASVPVTGAFPTPIPFPTLGVNVLNAPTVNAGTGFPTPQPLATTIGSLLNVSVTGTNAVTQVTSPWVVTTPAPYPTNASLVLKVDGSAVTQPVSGAFPTPIPIPTSASLYPKTVQCDPTTAANCAIISASGVSDGAICTIGATCATVGTTASDGMATSNNGLYTVDQMFGFNGTTWDRLRKDTFAAGPLWVTEGGMTKAVMLAGAAGPTVVKASAGRVSTYLITTAGSTGTLTLYDNASACSGTVIGIINGTTAQPLAIAGYVQKLDMPAALGITACGGTGSPSATLSFY